MAKSTESLSNLFTSRLQSLEFTRKKVNYLFSKKRIVRRDIEQIYQGLFLESVAGFEHYVEDLFLGLATKKIIPHSQRTALKVSFSSGQTARAVIFGNNKYCDWLPYNRTIERAEKYFKEGHPFSIINSSEEAEIKNFVYIRHAIAHKSEHAKKQFEDKVIGSTSLSPRERKVGAYLFGSFRSSPSQTRYENLVIEMATMFEKICSA